jgi:transposase
LVRRSGGKRIIIFEDETGFSLHPKLGRVWTKKGNQPYVYTRSQHQKRLNVFGWVAPFHGWHGMMKWVKGDTEGFLKLLRRILSRFKETIIDLWVDGAKWHKGERVERFCMEYHQLHIHYLPPYHPDLNYQEVLWHTMRYEETTNAFFEAIEDLEVSVFKRSLRWKPNKIKSMCRLT